MLKYNAFDTYVKRTETYSFVQFYNTDSVVENTFWYFNSRHD